MANKENLPPRLEGHPRLDDDRATPPGNISATLGIRPWVYSAPPFGLLSPNSKPSLARQRDHSACRTSNSPLRVRKTRENLKQASIYGEVPAPCMHGSIHDVANHSLPPSLSFTSATTVNSRSDRVGSSNHNNDSVKSPKLAAHVQKGTSTPVLAPPPLHTPSRIVRHKSVSRRVLSRVKEGITQRSRSSYGARAHETDSNLMRRLSAKHKSTNEEQSRLQGFEVCRDSIDSEPDVAGLDTTPQRSFTDSSIITDELIGTGFTVTPPSGFGHRSRPVSTEFLSPQLALRSPDQATPRPNRSLSAADVRVEPSAFQVCLPYVELTISPDRDAVDVGMSKEVWVAVEAVVRTRVVETSTDIKLRPAVVRKKPIDVVVIICQETLTESAPIVQQCMIELCSRLDEPDDRIACLLASSHQVDAQTMSCVCAELHPLQAPKTSALLERLGLAPCTARERLRRGTPDQPIHTALKEIVAKGPRSDFVHGIVLARSPAHLAQAITQSTTWPVHIFRTGLSPERAALANGRGPSWLFNIRHNGDLCALSLDNMFRDIRGTFSLGTVTSLRICYKAMDRSRILEVVGEKAVKDLQLGQRCSLFLKVFLPKLDTTAKNDQDSMFAELESMVGTLETNFLHVEARYRHSVLPTEDVVTIRRICTMRRPKTESRWSLISSAVAGLSSEHVHMKLASFLLSHHATPTALEAISRWELAGSPAVQQMCEAVKASLASPGVGPVRSTPSPAVIVTDTTRGSLESSPRARTATRASSAAVLLPMGGHTEPFHTASTTNKITTRIMSAPKGTTAISTYGRDVACSREGTPSDANDTARQLWQHLRRNSLSSKQMLEAMSHEELQQLEASDDALKVLRGQALANKRSVGAETLREWKWTDRTTQGAAPWL